MGLRWGLLEDKFIIVTFLTANYLLVELFFVSLVLSRSNTSPWEIGVQVAWHLWTEYILIVQKAHTNASKAQTQRLYMHRILSKPWRFHRQYMSLGKSSATSKNCVSSITHHLNHPNFMFSSLQIIREEIWNQNQKRTTYIVSTHQLDSKMSDKRYSNSTMDIHQPCSYFHLSFNYVFATF